MILVTGGTGFVGREVVAALLARGHRVRLLVRNPRRAAAWAHHPQVEIIRGDALQPETLPPALQGVETVVHLIGIIAETSKVTFEQAHTGATRHLLEAARGTGVTRWLQMSAEGTRMGATSRYHRTKWQAEELVRGSGLDWTIFRPSLIYGHDEYDRLLNLLRRVLSPPLSLLTLDSLPLLEEGKPLVQPVSVREVAHCFAQAVTHAGSIRKTYDLVGPVAFSWREMVEKIALDLGRSTVYEEFPATLFPRVVLIAAVVLLPVLIFGGLIAGWFGYLPAEAGGVVWIFLALLLWRKRRTVIFSIPGEPLLLLARLIKTSAPRSLQFQEQLHMALEDNIGDPAPAMKAFAYTPETFEQGLRNLSS